MKLTKELAQDLGRCQTVDPQRLHDLTTRGSNAPEPVQEAARRLRASWELATARARRDLLQAQGENDVYRIQLAQIAFAEQDEDWRQEMMQHTQTVMLKIRQRRRERVEALRDRHERDRRWVTFWKEARLAYIKTEQERWRAVRKSWVKRGVEMVEAGASEVRLAHIDRAIDVISRWEREVPTDKKSSKIACKVAHAECREEASREAYLLACRQIE